MHSMWKFPLLYLVLALLLTQPLSTQAQSVSALRLTEAKITSQQQKLITEWLSERITTMADKDNLLKAIEARSEILMQADGATSLFLTAYVAGLNDTLKAELNRQRDNDLLAFNAAFCLANLQQPSSSALLTELLKAKSTAARYWAVKGLSALLSSANNPDSARIIQSLSAAAVKESSPLVLGRIYANLDKADPEPSLKALLKVMDPRLKAYRDAKVIGPQAELGAIAAAAQIWAKLDQSQQNDLAKRIGQLMAFSALRYTRDYNDLTPYLRKNLERIVIAAEALLSQMAKARLSDVGTPLKQALKSAQADRLARISAALDAWAATDGAKEYHLKIFNAKPVDPLREPRAP